MSEELQQELSRLVNLTQFFFELGEDSPVKKGLEGILASQELQAGMHCLSTETLLQRGKLLSIASALEK